MAVESYGRTDDGIAWVVHHRLGGPWWWTMRLPDGQALQSTYLYDTEQQALDAVEEARQQALAVLPAAETMASLRAKLVAAEARAAQVEADARMMLVELMELAESEGTDAVAYWQDLGLTGEECHRLRAWVRRAPPVADEWNIEAVRRILATAGAT